MVRHNPVQMLGVAVHSLLQQKLRAALSILGVVCGVMAVVAMIAVGQGAKMAAMRQIERLGVRNVYIRALDLTPAQRASAGEQRSAGLNSGDMRRIVRGGAPVAAVAGLRDIRVALVGTPAAVAPAVVACSANYADLLGMHVASGRFLTPADERQKNLVCVLGHDVARRMGGDGQRMDVIRMGDHLVKVVGILHRRLATPAGSPSAIVQRDTNAMVFIPLAVAAALAGAEGAPQAGLMAGAPELSEIIAQIRPGADVVAAARLVDRILAVAHQDVRDYQLIVPLELLDQARQTQRTFNLVLGAIAGISLLVGGIGIMNIMLATVSERTREIGIRRAVGATRRDILLHFLTEAAVLTVSGGLIGMVGGLGAVGLILRLTGWPMALSVWGLLLPLGVALLVGVGFGLYPARKAAGVDPIVALRHE